MADVKEEHIIDLNRLNFGGSGKPKGMYFQGEVNQAYFGSTKVFNRALYHMEAPWDGYFPADARPFDLKNMLANFNFSWKKDLAGTNKDVQQSVEWYMEDPSQEVLPGNTDENNAKDTEFTLTQYLSGLQVTGLVRQAKDEKLREEYRNAEITSVGYQKETAPAAGSDNIPLLVSFSGYKVPVWASGKEATAEAWGGTVRSGFLSLSGRSLEDDVYFDPSTGAVDAPYLADNPMDERQIAVVTYVKISTDAGELEWSGTKYLYQDANVKSNDGSPTYDIYSFPSSYEVTGGETYIYIHITRAFKTQEVKWTSGYEDSEIEDTYVRLSTDVGTLDDSILYGANNTILNIPQNGSSSRKINVRVYNTAAGYDVTHTITQEAYEEKEVWEYPFISGTVSVDEIPADGSGALLNATVIQYKKKGDSIIQTYYPSITALVGTAVSGTGYSYLNGVVYADSMGTTEYKNGRKVFTISKLTVMGGDGKEYTLALSSSLQVWQAPNVWEFVEYGNYILSVSASPSTGIPALGGTSTITASAQIERIYEWSSGEGRDTELSSSNANLKTSVGTISPTSIMGTNQKATLTLGENTGAARSALVTLYIGGENAPCYVTQNKASYIFVPKQGSSFEMAYNSKSFSVAYECRVNDTAVKPTVEVSGDNISGYSVSQSTSSPYPWVVLVTLENTNTGNQNLVYTVKVTHPKDSSLTETVTVTHKTAASDKPTWMDVYYAVSNGWYLGRCKAASTTMNGTTVGVYAIVAAKKNSISSSSTLTWEFTTDNLIPNPNGSGLVASGNPLPVSGTKVVSAGTETTIGSYVIYGIQIVAPAPGRFIDQTKTLKFTAT